MRRKRVVVVRCGGATCVAVAVGAVAVGILLIKISQKKVHIFNFNY